MIIPEPNFYLKDIKSSEPTLIYMQAKYSYNGTHRLMISTGDKSLVSNWDFEKKRAIVTKKNSAGSDTNLWLDKMVASFKSAFRNCLIDSILPTPQVIKEKMELLLNINQAPTAAEINFYSFFEKFIIDSKAGKSKDTIKCYVTTLRQIMKYGASCGKKFNFIDITLEWRIGFINFLQSNGVGINSCGKHIKIVKVVLNEATERGYNSNLAFRGKSFTKPCEDVQSIFLTTEEVLKIANLDLTDNKGSLRLERQFLNRAISVSSICEKDIFS